MQENKLTDNGIDKVLGGVNGVVVQVLKLVEKKKKGTDYFGCELNDGYSKVKCMIIDEEILTKKKAIKENMIIVVMRGVNQPNNGGTPVIIVENYSVQTDKVNYVVGSPIFYDQFVKKGKKNPNGDNHYTISSKEEKPANKYGYLVDDDQEEETAGQPVSKNGKKEIKPVRNQTNNLKAPSNGTKGNLRLSHEEETKGNQNSSSFRSNNLKSNQLNPPRPKVESPQPPNRNSSTNQNRNQNRPIEKIPQKGTSAMVGNPTRNLNTYNRIKDLYPGMQNVVLFVRVLFVNPAKSFVNKRGLESELRSIEIADKSGSIECTMFGQVVQKFQGIFVEGQVYEISNVVVTQNTYLGKTTTRMTINESSRVSLKEDNDPSVPDVQDFCCSVKELTEIPIGESVNVICLIKDSGEVQDIVTKAGKQMTKKMVYYCDPKDKVEVEVIYWNERCGDVFEKVPYVVHAMRVQEYNSNRSYNLGKNYYIRPLKSHPLKKYAYDLQNIECVNPDSEHKQKRSTISNLMELNQAMDVVTEKGTWSEVVGCVTNIKTSSRPYYLACPHCNKKVQERATQCAKCDKEFEAPRPKYIMQLSISDHFDGMWVNAYDEVGTIILGVKASEYAEFSEEEVQDLVKKLKYKEFKFKMVTKSEEYNNEARKKTTIIKILNLSYAIEAQSLAKKLMYLTGH